jgi:FeS assembly SUF system protein
MSEELPPTTPTSAPTPASGPGEAADGSKPLDERVVDALRTIYDPEIPVDIYELGLIYDVNIAADNGVHIVMTLTSPSCPVAGSLPGDVEKKVASVQGVASTKVDLTWDPAWTPEKMSEAAKLKLGMV